MTVGLRLPDFFGTGSLYPHRHQARECAGWQIFGEVRLRTKSIMALWESRASQDLVDLVIWHDEFAFSIPPLPAQLV